MESMVGKKVLGGFVMTTGPDDPGTVISIGTGIFKSHIFENICFYDMLFNLYDEA